MSPFRGLLKPSNATKGMFEETKQAICNVVPEGLAYFDTSKVTADITDWCKIGIGFPVKQKHCHSVISPQNFGEESGFSKGFTQGG